MYHMPDFNSISNLDLHWWFGAKELQAIVYKFWSSVSLGDTKYTNPSKPAIETFCFKALPRIYLKKAIAMITGEKNDIDGLTQDG